MQKINNFCTPTRCIWFSLVGLLIIRNISGNTTTTTTLQIIRFFIIKIIILLLLEIRIILVFVIPVFLVTAVTIKVQLQHCFFFYQNLYCLSFNSVISYMLIIAASGFSFYLVSIHYIIFVIVFWFSLFNFLFYACNSFFFKGFNFLFSFPLQFLLLHPDLIRSIITNKNE